VSEILQQINSTLSALPEEQLGEVARILGIEDSENVSLETLEVGKRYWFRGELCELMTMEDCEGRICMKTASGYKMAKKHDLKPPPEATFNYWWNNNTFMIRKLEPRGVILLSIPKSLLPDMRRVMFTKKALVRESRKP
jgi:hypothetical protein